MMNIFSSFYQLILLLLLAPLAAGLVKFFKARFQGRKGASPFLPYFTLLTLLKKEMVISDSTSWVFRLAPFVVFGSALFLILLLPLITLVGGFSEYSNFVIVAGVLMLTAVFLVFGGMESASAFGGMGAAREMAIASLVEPTMILIFAAMAINSTTSQISGMLSQLNIFEQPFMLFSLLALVLLALAENARYPVDNPATHLELTMVHEAMVLEYSGPYLALMEYPSFLKLSPFLPMYQKMTSEEFLKKSMGINVWNRLWKQLFRGKFGIYVGIISSSFIWARINKRTKALGYINGGFQSFINFIENRLRSLWVTVLTGCEIKRITKQGGKFKIDCHSREGGNPEDNKYDVVISTLPTPVLSKLTSNIFSKEYLSHFNKLKYLHAITLILETDNPILDQTYWLNICTEKIPFMILAQHTNFSDKKNYNNHHLAYVGWYVDRDSKLLKMDKNEILKLVNPSLIILNFKFFFIQGGFCSADF